MRKIIVSEYLSLDGVFEDPGGTEGTPQGGWSIKLNSKEQQAYKFKELVEADALLLGRHTYEGFAVAWPHMEGTGEFGERMNAIPKYVVTTTLDALEWNNSHVVSGDIVDEVRKLKSSDGKNILVAGSGQLVRLLLDNGLVDMLCLMLYPVVLGSGKQLLPGANYTALQLTNTQTFSTGTVVLEYTAS